MNRGPPRADTVDRALVSNRQRLKEVVILNIRRVKEIGVAIVDEGSVKTLEDVHVGGRVEGGVTVNGTSENGVWACGGGEGGGGGGGGGGHLQRQHGMQVMRHRGSGRTETVWMEMEMDG